ncbi:MAG: hypothetical protein KatS3mg013_1557 [Actinomycetota bacterium]|nr:MAG: hypothetical protein KatS3mg013_1557 [Actinomycetota bacterium]
MIGGRPKPRGTRWPLAGGLAVAFLLLGAVAGLVHELGVEREVRALERASERAGQRLWPLLRGVDPAAPLGDRLSEELNRALQDVRGEGVERARVITDRGAIVVSSDPLDRPGARAGLEASLLQRAVAGATASERTQDPLAGDDVLRTVAPIAEASGSRSEFVLVVDRSLDVVEGAAGPWPTLRLVAFAAAAVLGVVALVSLREWLGSRGGPGRASGPAQASGGATAGPPGQQPGATTSSPRSPRTAGAWIARRRAGRRAGRSQAAAEERETPREDLRLAVARAEERAREAEERAREAEERAREAEERAREAEERAREAEERAREAEAEHGRLAAELEEARAELARLGEEVEALRAAPAPTREPHVAISGGSVQAQAALEAALERARLAEERAGRAEDRVTQIEAHASTLASALEEQRVRREHLERMMGDAQAELERLRGRADELEGFAALAGRERDLAREREAAVAAELDRLRAELAAALERARQLAESAGRAEGLERELEEARRSAESAEARWAERVAALERELAMATAAAAEARTALDAATQRAHEELRRSLERVRIEAEAELERLRRSAAEQAAALERQVAELERELAAERARAAALETELARSPAATPSTPILPEGEVPPPTPPPTPVAGSQVELPPPPADAEAEGEGPSLRFRLARAAERKHGQGSH